ncbi:MAG: hypothetical protein M3Z14_01810 [Candidatus Eremiobacteraeota bacterium]|nr:hypothetical protein [Candidatus Eremiobacteraeota bacterium]
MKIIHNTIIGSIASAFLLLGGLPAAASTSIVGGAFAPSSNIGKVNSVGAVVTTAVPGVPFVSAQVQPQISLAAPIAPGSRYALTGEVETKGDTSIGIGAGIGRLRNNGKVGFVYDFIGAAKVAPHTSVVARYYAGETSAIGTTGFLGLKFSI